MSKTGMAASADAAIPVSGIFGTGTGRKRAAKAVLQLLYIETDTAEWLFHQEKCTLHVP
jgi:hypothetical protein